MGFAALVCMVTIIASQAAIAQDKPNEAKAADEKGKTSTATLHLVFVLDGCDLTALRRQKPNLYRLRTEGVWFENSHSVFPR